MRCLSGDAMRSRRSLTLDLLPKLGLAAERDLAEAAAQVLALPLVGARDYPAVPLFGARQTCTNTQDPAF